MLLFFTYKREKQVTSDQAVFTSRLSNTKGKESQMLTCSDAGVVLVTDALLEFHRADFE